MTSSSIVDFAVVAGTVLLIVARFARNEVTAKRARLAAYLLYAVLPIYLVTTQAASIQRLGQELGVSGRDAAAMSVQLRIMVLCGVLAAIAMVYFGLTGTDPVIAAREWVGRLRVRQRESKPVDLSGLYAVAAGLLLMALITIGAFVVALVVVTRPEGLRAAILGDSSWQLALVIVLWLPGAAKWYSLVYFLGPAAFFIVLAVALVLRKRWARRWIMGLMATLLFTFATGLLVSLYTGDVSWLPIVVTIFCGWTLWYLSAPEVVAAFDQPKAGSCTKAGAQKAGN